MKRSGYYFILPIFLLVCAWGCSRDSLHLEAEEPDYLTVLQSTGLTKYMGIEPETMIQVGDWEVYHYGKNSPAICLKGAEFVASLRRGDPKKVVLYLQGGGACWDYFSCYGLPMAQEVASGPPGEGGGFLITDNTTNPLRDWSVVYASYCDGSVWSGDNDVTYYKEEDGVPIGEGKLTCHHGLQNLSAALTLLKKNFPFPDKILVSGSSAGGYGTLIGSMATRLQYSYTPIHVINDSGPDIVNPKYPFLTESAKKNWKFEQFLPEGIECPKCEEQMIFIIGWILNHDPIIKYGLFSYYNDLVIGTIFLGLKSEQYRELLVSITNELHAMHPETFKRFFIEGYSHTTFDLSTYYSAEVRGTHFNEWVDDLVNDSPDWADLLE